MSRLTQDQEDDLRGFFCGSLEVAAGCRSSLGPALDRLQYNLPEGIGAFLTSCYHDDERGLVVIQQPLVHNDAEDRLIDCMALIARQRLIRAALRSIPRAAAETLRTAFSPIPNQMVWGLINHFGDRETAAVAIASVELSTPGASKSEKLLRLVTKACNSPRAADELNARRTAARAAIRDAIDAYAPALRAVLDEARDEKRRRFEELLAKARLAKAWRQPCRTF